MTEEKQEILTCRKKSRFSEKLPDRKVDAVLGLSVENKNLKGEALKALVNLVNLPENAVKIRTLKVVMSDYLQRHYYGEAKAEEIRNAVLAEIEPILAKVNKYIKVEIVSWKDFYNSENFASTHEKIKEIYEKDEIFRQKVDNVAKVHQAKAGFEPARDYLLEECVLFFLTKGSFLYPSKALPTPITHIIDNYNPELTFFPYAVFDKPDKTKRQAKKVFEPISQHQVPSNDDNDEADETLISALAKVSQLLASRGVARKDRVGFFANYLSLEEGLRKNLFKQSQGIENGYNTIKFAD